MVSGASGAPKHASRADLPEARRPPGRRAPRRKAPEGQPCARAAGLQCRISLATPGAMARPFNRRQALENQAFLAALRRTGNARLAARELGLHRSTFLKRRARHPAFAAEWDAALTLAHARLNDPPRAGSGRGPCA